MKKLVFFLAYGSIGKTKSLIVIERVTNTTGSRPVTHGMIKKMFFKHNDSLKRRVWLGIGEALLAAYVFGMLYFLPMISFGKFGSTGHSVVQDLARIFSELIVVGFFAIAMSLHTVIPVGALLGFLLPKVAVKCNPIQALLIGGIGGVILAVGAAALIGLPFDTLPAATLRFWTTSDYFGRQLAVYCALWIGYRLAYLSKHVRAEN